MSSQKKQPNVFLSTVVSTVLSSVSLFAAVNIDSRAEAIVVPGDPNDYLVSPGTGYDGVALLDIQFADGFGACSAALLPTGRHVLTAAHCLTSSIDTEEFLPGIPGGTVIAQGATAFFDLPTGRVGVNAAEFYIHPDWNGKYYNGNDLAVIKLVAEAPETSERYNIYRGNDELGQISTKVGYGLTGNGNTGFIAVFDGNKRAGQNTYDALGEAVNGVFPGVDFPLGKALLYDFDNGNPTNDALGSIAGITNLGLGTNEVYPSFGDSGAPTFIQGSIAGIISDGIRQALISETDSIPYNSGFGEIGFDTRVSSYASYIDSVLEGRIKPTYKVPEPDTTIYGTVFALSAFAINSWSKRKAGSRKANSGSQLF